VYNRARGDRATNENDAVGSFYSVTKICFFFLCAMMPINATLDGNMASPAGSGTISELWTIAPQCFGWVYTPLSESLRLGFCGAYYLRALLGHKFRQRVAGLWFQCPFAANNFSQALV